MSEVHRRQLTPVPWAAAAPSDRDVRRRVRHLMLFRLVLITLVLAVTVGLSVDAPAEEPLHIGLYALMAVTFALTGVYALVLERVKNPVRFADVQIAGDLALTTVLVHLTGGAQSGYVFFYPLSIISATLVRYRRGALIVSIAGATLYAAVSLLAWNRLLPEIQATSAHAWELPREVLIRTLVINGGAFAAVAVLAALLGRQLARTGGELVTARARAAQMTQLSEDIIRCLSSGLLAVDTKGIVGVHNEAAQEILGQPLGTAVGRPLGESLPEAAALLSELGSTGMIRRGELKVKSDGGRDLTLGVSISPLRDPDGTARGHLINFQDLTDLRHMELQVQRGQRLAVIGQLAASVAHELRNPLAAISGSIELLRTGPSADPEGRALMDIVLREVERLNGMVTDLLEYSRPRERVPAALDLAALVRDTVRVFENDRTHAGVTVTASLPDDECPVLADADQLRQVVWNLLRNAAQAMPEGGKIQVRVGRARDEAGGDLVELAVADDGVGIPAADLERIFDPFYTTKARGTGLGLAILHRVVTEHGGTIAVHSSPGQGTTMTIRLPAPKKS